MTLAATDVVRLFDADYLHFVAAAAWMVNTGLALAFLIPRQGATASVADRGFWLTVAAVFLAVACVCTAELLERYAALFDWPMLLDAASHAGAVAATLLTLAALPRPAGFRRRAVWRTAVGITALAACGIVVATPSIAFGWWLVVGAGATGAYMLAPTLSGLARDGSARRGVWEAEGRVRVFVALGAMLLALAVVFALRHGAELVRGWPDDGRGLRALVRGWQGIALGLAGVGVFGALWSEYLRECTLPRVRARRGIFGVRPALVLPLLLTVVLGAGSVWFLSSSRQAETYVAGRFSAEVESVVTLTLTGPAAIAPAGPETATPAPDGQAWLVRRTLERLLEHSRSISGAVAWREVGGRPDVLAAVSRAGPGEPFDAALLLPDDARGGGRGMVRWIHGDSPYERVVLDAGEIAAPAAGGASWRLALALDSRDLARLIAAHRLQTLAILALAVIIVAFAVVYTLRTLNEAELRLLKESAEAENSGRNAFLGMISHEIRTPLQSVLGYAELAETAELPEAAARHVRAIRTQGAILLRIVQDILDFSALRGGGLTLNPEPVSLRELLDDVQRGLAGRAAAKGIVFSTEIEPAVPAWITVDRVRLAQVLLNLAVNAVKFTDRGGVRLAVGCAGVDQGRARIGILISDTGPGMSPAQMRRLFEPFRKMRDDDTPGGGGVGLGLAITRHIVDLLGGTISAESVDGEGTTFHLGFELPVATAPAGPAADAVAPEGGPVPSLAGLHVLLIDDNPHVRGLLRDFLRKLGARVCVRPDGASGLAACASDRFDVILLDLRLPDVPGSELAARLRAAGRSATDPWIVGISAGVSDAEIQQTLERGVNDFMLKPVSMAGLAETIRMSPAAARIEPDAAPVPAIAGGASADQRAAFFAEIEPMFDRLERSCREAEGARLGAEAHYLANGCMVTGFDDGLRLCREIEHLAEAGAYDAARERIVALRRVFAVAPLGGSAAAGATRGT